MALTLDDYIKEYERSSSNAADSMNSGIQNDEQANYYLRLLAESKFEESKIRKQAENKRKKYEEIITEWENDNVKGLVSKQDYFTMLLTDYVNKKRNGKTGTEKFIYGNVKISKQQNKYDYEEDEVIIDELRNNGLEQFVSSQVKESINKTELKKAGSVVNGKLAINGHILNSITVTPRENAVSVNVDDTIKEMFAETLVN
jgi:phage host-nuclease inhibitor protein Gam